MDSRPLRSRAVAVLVACLLSAVTACGTAGGAAPQPVRVASTQAAAAPSDAVELRSALQMLLGEHVLLTVELMRERIRGAGERTDAALGAVERNTDDLTGAVGQLFGEEAGTTFGALWSAHVRQLSDYSGALVAQDRAAADAARADLLRTEEDIARFLSTAAGPGVDPQQWLDAVRTHVEMLLEQADAYAAGDFETAYRHQQHAFQHMIETAGVMADALASARGLPRGDFEAPQRTLQTALGRLLAEHMTLMVQATRATLDRSEEVAAATTALNANTTELGSAVGALYGEPAAQQFLELWARHVEALVQYADATASGADTSEAEAALEAFEGELAGFLATATDGRLPADDLAAALTEHDEHLTAYVDALAAEDPERAQEQVITGYRHMFAVAQQLATAVGDAVAARLPTGGAATGGGGSAAAG
jgi:hypothetical protein